jgi:hypothetical protein
VTRGAALLAVLIGTAALRATTSRRASRRRPAFAKGTR